MFHGFAKYDMTQLELAFVGPNPTQLCGLRTPEPGW